MGNVSGSPHGLLFFISLVSRSLVNVTPDTPILQSRLDEMADVEKAPIPSPADHAEGGPDLVASEQEKVGGIILKHADRNNADEALKVLQGLDGETIVLTPEEEKKLLRKIDYNMSIVSHLSRPFA